MRDYRITADITADILDDLKKRLLKRGLHLRGRYGCGKMLYEKILRKGIVELMGNRKEFEKALAEIIKEQGRGS